MQLLKTIYKTGAKLMFSAGYFFILFLKTLEPLKVVFKWDFPGKTLLRTLKNVIENLNFP